ncbi:helix-turn-helix domain-containing protein [Paenibacillus chungangensis]|uniref:Helix-turn-helix domain-containing protein n=1 Tax=Paenibacillus chungangensis TaxID=696535 RepID=A0ABW3HUW2_9BACL
MNQRKTVFLTLWLSYLLILAIPVAVSAYLYHNMKDALVDNANRSNMAMLEQVREVVENHLTDLEQLSMQVASHPKLQTLWNMNDGQRYIDYWEAMKVLNNMQLGSKFIHNFFLYLHDQDILLSQNMKTDTTTYFSDIVPYKDKTVDEVKELLFTGYHFNSFWPSMTVYDQSKEKNMITSAITLPMGEKQNVRATLVMYIDEQHIFNLLNQIKWANSASMYIVDATGETILSYSEHGMELGEGILTRLQGTNHYEATSYNGERMLLSHTTGNSGWTYVSLAPEKAVLSRVTDLQSQALTLLVIAILAGTAIAYGMAYRSYSPIRDMVLSLMNGHGDASASAPAVTRMNEYEFIKSSIKHNLEEGKKLRQALEGHTPVVRAHYLSRLLKGQVTTSTFKQDSLDFIDVKFHTDYLSVALIEVDDCTRFIKNNNEEEWALVRFILANLSQELIKEKGHVIETEHNQLALLLQSPDASGTSRAERDKIITELKNLIKSRFKMDITIAYSSIREGLEEVGRCYSEALSALDYRIVHGIGKMIDYEDIKGLERQYYHYPMDVETQLMNMLKAGDYAGTEKLLDVLYEKNIASGIMTPEMGKCLFFDLLSTVLKVMNALKLDTASDDSGSFDPAKEFLNSTSAIDMQSRLKELCQGICSSVQEARSAQGDRLNNELLAFIEQHYKDNSLSLTMIADHFNMTPQYISGYFKKHNNRNLTDYIVDIRLTEAKRLLAESGCTVLQVAQQVGYATDIGFIRVFKKQEGITPGKYREMNAS